MLLSILFLVFLIFVNAIFSMAELAFLSVNKLDLREAATNGSSRAKRVDKILDNTSLFLSTIQIGITFAGFFASALAADYFADYFMDMISITFLSAKVLRTILVVLITIVLSYFTLVFGELVPKRVAMHNPLKIACSLVGLITVISKLFYPIVKLLSFSTDLVCKIFNIKEQVSDLTEEDIKKMIILGGDEGVLERKEREYILNIFEFNDVEVSKVMTPLKKVICLNVDDDIKNIIAIIKDKKFTRYPVYKGHVDNIIGILNVKDLIIKHGKEESLNLNKIIRKVNRVQHDEKIDDVFRYMQEEKDGIALVYDKSTFVGVVTVEDAVEEIVGNIYDEFDNK